MVKDYSKHYNDLTKLMGELGIKIPATIAFHVHDALKSGASSEEVVETIGVAILMGGGPELMYGFEALEALNQLVVLEKNG